MEHSTIQEGGATGDLAKAQTQLWNLMLSYIDSMTVRCAVELGIPDAIHDRGGRHVSVPELMAALSIPASGGSRLSRLMRILCRAGFLAAESSAAGDGGTCYSLTDVSRLVLKGGSHCQAEMVLMLTGRIVTDPFPLLSAWFRHGGGGGGEPTTAFQLAHGRSFWDMTGQDREFNELFNGAMSGDSCFLMNVLIKECGCVFRGIRSLVDVGGGTGSAARAISEAFPELKCTVLDLPHVVNAAPAPAAENTTVEFVAGDMFDYIPRADAVLLKWILHDWKDEDCVRILQRCKEAIPAKEEGGKVIIIDMVVNADNLQPQSIKVQLNFDMLMAVLYGAIEREEHEWRNLFEKAGFSSYRYATHHRSVSMISF